MRIRAKVNVEGKRSRVALKDFETSLSLAGMGILRREYHRGKWKSDIGKERARSIVPCKDGEKEGTG
jgi:hypothetical protein